MQLLTRCKCLSSEGAFAFFDRRCLLEMLLNTRRAVRKLDVFIGVLAYRYYRSYSSIYVYIENYISMNNIEILNEKRNIKMLYLITN